MTFQHYRHRIKGHHDFEFSSVRDRTLEYTITIPDGNVKGLVVLINGFGKDTGPYSEKFQQHISNDYSLACLVVEYHCLFCRAIAGKTELNVTINPSVEKLLRGFTGCTNGGESITDIIAAANRIKANKDIPLEVPGIIKPEKGEYQNFGLLPALDIICSLQDVFEKYPIIPKIVFAIGSSYGGYLANLVSKLAPSTINSVFDNSGWVKPSLKYIVGADTGEEEAHMPFNGAVLNLNVLSPWSANPFMPNSFGIDRQLIRSFPDLHLNIMQASGKLKTIYYFVHAQNDLISNTDEKVELVERMCKMGFKTFLSVFKEKDVDGRYIKNMAHGMGLSLRQFFSNCYEKVRPLIRNDQKTDFDFDHVLKFPCDTLEYTIRYEQKKMPVCKVYRICSD